MPHIEVPRGPEGDGLVRDLVGRLPAAVYVARSGVQGEWLFVSPQIMGILGFAPEEFLADPGLWERQLHPDDRARVLAAEDARGRGELAQAYVEYRMLGKDGRVVWVLDDVTLTPDGDNETMQQGLLYDITRRKRAEVLLAEHADIFERIASGDDLLKVLQALARSTQTISGADACTVSVHHAVARFGGLAVNANGMVDAPDDPEQEGVPFHDSDGELLGHILIEGDVTELDVSSEEGQEGVMWATRLASLAIESARQDERMETSYSLLAATLESTADGILVVDGSGRIARHNQNFREMWRLPEELIAAGDDDQLIGYVLKQLTDPAAFVAEVGRLYSSPELSSFDTLEFLDGRVFERYSQPQRLDGKSVGRVWSFRDMTSYRQLETELRRQAHTDQLTALPNRYMFMERLTTLLAEQDEADLTSTVGMLLIDLDDFKTVNDGLGHLAGDMLLVKVAERLVACVRAEDMAARLGGDEFVVLLEHLTDVDHATMLADRIVAALAEPVDLEGRSMSVRASVGIAIAGPGTAAGELVRNADLAMYTAKREGGAGHRLYVPPMHSEAMERLDLKADLARALDRDELSVHYQSMMSLDTMRIETFEALVRWQHPQRGLIPPVDFIPLAEEMGMIDRIGQWVLAEACAEAARWLEACGPGKAPTISVNLSPRQISNPALTDEIRDVLAATGLPAAALCLEITESALAQSDVDVVGVLNTVKSLGVKLALDDFGTGHSSLGRLGLYPFDVVKIDMSFVHRLVEDRGSAAVVEAILLLAEAFELDVVAEGIETQEQLAALQTLGCPKGQGYLFSRPVPAEDARQMLTQA